MAAFDKANTVRRFQLQAIVKELFHPGTGGVNQPFGAPGVGFAGIDVFRFHHPQAGFTPGAGYAGAGAHFAALFHHFLRVKHHHARIVYPAVGIFETARNFRLQGRFRAKTQTFTAWQRSALTEAIVHKQAHADHPRRTQMRAVWQTETHREGDVWRHFQQHFTFGQRFAHQTEFVMFQIAQATVNQLGTGRGGCTGQIPRLQHQH